MTERPVQTAPSLASRLTAEAIGTFLLVFGGVGTALFASHLADEAGAFAPGVVYLAAATAFGLTVVVGASAFAGVSGAHFNPAVTIGLAAAGRFAWADTWKYIVVQVVGGVIASTFLVLIGLFGPAGWLEAAQNGGFASNGWDSLSPGGFGLPAAIIVEVVLTAVFVIVILGVTHPERGTTLAPLAIGLTLTLIHLISIAVDNTSVNPARSIATALYGGGTALAQLWVFIVFPIVGALLAGFSYRALFETTG
ncbi:aquaporin [Microbacterium betulae]|uniref:Aquaporin n=1 Tax=Microbacterium betulae TaxID=2981139 RepID=A0AA97I810_9MICO|nr:aquaporin [Microbacterium sp. AB]WOF24197.1 aquaporin [Microbacterium sp. AB]